MKIETDRLIIREFHELDLDQLFVILSNEEVMRYSIAGPAKEKNQAKQFLDGSIKYYKTHGFGIYALEEKQNHELIGFVGLLKHGSKEQEKIEILYRLLPQYWGKGLASEGVIALLRYAFDVLKIDKIHAFVEPDNTPSSSLAKKVGMQFIGLDKYEDVEVEIYQITNNKSKS